MLNGFKLYKKLLITSSVMALSILSCNLDGFNNSKNSLKSTNSTSKLKLSKSKENLTNFINEVKNSKIITKDISNNKIKEISLHDFLKKDSKTFNTKALYPLITIAYELSNPSTGTFNSRTIPGIPPNPSTTVWDSFSFTYTRHSSFSVDENTNFSFLVNSSFSYDAVSTCSKISFSDSLEYSSGINISPQNFPYNLENGKNIHDSTVTEQMILPLWALQNGSNHFTINESTLDFDVPLTGKQKIVLDVNVDQINLSQNPDIIIKSSPNTMDPFNVSLISPDGTETSIAQCKRFTDSFSTFNSDFIPINYKIPQSLPEGEYKIKSYLVANPSVFTEFPITLIKDIQATPTPQPSSDPCNTSSSTAFSVKALSTEDRNNLNFLKQMISQVEEIISVENVEKDINVILASLYGNSGFIYTNNGYLDKVKPDNYRKLNTILSKLDTFISNSTGKTNQYSLELKTKTSFLLSQIGVFSYILSEVQTMYDVRISELNSLKQLLLEEAKVISRKLDKVEKLSVLQSLTNKLLDANSILLSKNHSGENRTMIEELVFVNSQVASLSSCLTTGNCGNVFSQFVTAQMELFQVAEKSKNIIQDIKNSLDLHQILPSDPDSDVRNMLAKLDLDMTKIDNIIQHAKAVSNIPDPSSEMTLALQNVQEIKLDLESLNLELAQEIAQAEKEKEECKKINAALSLKADKKSFSPNNDNIDDIVSFSIIAAKDKPWTLEISKIQDNTQTQDEYDKAVDEYLGTSTLPQEYQGKKTFSGIGTGENQSLLWDGYDDNNNIIPDGKYSLTLKSNDIEVKKILSKTGAIDLLFNSEMTVEPATEENITTNTFSTKAIVPIKNNGTFTVGNGDQATLGMETFWDTRFPIKDNEFVNITGLFLLVGPDKNGKPKVIARYPNKAFSLNINASNYLDREKNRFKYITPWFGRDEIRGGTIYDKKGPFMAKDGKHEIVFKKLTTQTNIAGFKIDSNVSTKLSKFKVINNFNVYGDTAPYYVNGGSQEFDLKNNAKYHIREAHDINFMNAKAFVNINAYLHDQSKYLSSLNNIVRAYPKEISPDKKGICFNKNWSPDKIFEKIESVANMEYTFDTWTTGNPDVIQSYRYTGTKPNYTITDYSRRENHNIQVLFNNYSDSFGNKNIKIATGYPDIDATLGDAIALGNVRQYFEILMLNGFASDSATKNQVYQSTLDIFKESLKWSNDGSTGALTPLTKSIIFEFDKVANANRLLYNPQDQRTFNRKLKRITIGNLNDKNNLIYPNSLSDVFTTLNGVNY